MNLNPSCSKTFARTSPRSILDHFWSARTLDCATPSNEFDGFSECLKISPKRPPELENDTKKSQKLTIVGSWAASGHSRSALRGFRSTPGGLLGASRNFKKLKPPGRPQGSPGRLRDLSQGVPPGYDFGHPGAHFAAIL